MTESPDHIVPGADDARSVNTDTVNADRSIEAAAASSRVRKGIEATKPAPLLSSRQRDFALVAAAGVIGFAISGIVAR